MSSNRKLDTPSFRSSWLRDFSPPFTRFFRRWLAAVSLPVGYQRIHPVGVQHEDVERAPGVQRAQVRIG